MGQRLNLVVRSEDDNTLINVYYHWSGYTVSGMHVALEFVDKYKEQIQKKKDKLILIDFVRTLKSLGANLTSDEEEYVKNMFKKNIANKLLEPNGKQIDRNFGLIAVSPQGIDITESWAEATLVVNVSKEGITFNIKEMFWKKTKQEMAEDYDTTIGRIKPSRRIPQNPFGEDITNIWRSLTEEQFRQVFKVLSNEKRKFGAFSIKMGEFPENYFSIIE